VKRETFFRILFAILVVAFGVRASYVYFAKDGPCVIRTADGAVVGSSPSKCATGDELFYNGAANFLADGHGFNDPYYQLSHPGEDAPPAADHPPLTIMVLAPVSWLVDHPPLSWVIDNDLDDHMREHRYTMVVLGTVLVLLIGLLGRRVGGGAVGLVAAGIAAVLPTLWVNDGLVMSETVTGLMVVSAMLCALALRDKPNVPRALALGAFCGLAALARAELIIFVPLLALVVTLTVKRPWSDRSSLAIAALLASLFVVGPWVAYNNVRFDERTLLSTNDGIAIAGSNCDPVYWGTAIGLTNLSECIFPQPDGDQSVVAKALRRRAFDYMRDNKGRVPVVVLARIGRTWSVYRPGDMVAFNVNEDREEWVTRLGLVAFYPTLIGAVAGAVVLWRRRRRAELWVLLVPAVAVTFGAAISYGQTRFRAAAEPSLAILAAVAGVALVSWLRRRYTLTTADSSASSSDTTDAGVDGNLENASTAIP
jgi:hypothetical protein